jgi:hypothetical protein
MSMLLVHELHEARDRILLLRQQLTEAREKELSSYNPFLNEQIDLLSDALEQAKIPERYRVAVDASRMRGATDSAVLWTADANSGLGMPQGPRVQDQPSGAQTRFFPCRPEGVSTAPPPPRSDTYWACRNRTHLVHSA